MPPTPPPELHGLYTTTATVLARLEYRILEFNLTAQSLSDLRDLHKSIARGGFPPSK